MSRKTGISGETKGEGEAKGVENGNEDGDKGHFSEKCGEIDSASNEEQILRDRMHKLYELRAVEIEELSKAYDRIHSLLTGSSDDPNEISEVWKGREIFNEKWKNFVDIHEQYYSLLKEECQREYACSIYEGQKRRKLELDAMASEWRIRQDMSKMKLRNILGSRSSKSSKGGKSDGSATTSRMSRQSRKKEEMALAQLKLEQIKRRQILEREEQELRRKRELMEAEMEAEQAVLSFQTVSEFQDQIFPIERADKPITKNKELSNSDKLSTDSKEKEWFRGINKKIETENQCNATISVPAQGQQSSTRKPAESQHTEHATGQQFNQEIAGVLRQVVNSPKIEYLKFSGDPLKYVTFMHNFEICLEKDNLDPDRRLQLLIQHCVGKAREAIESCINLENGYEVAKATLKANFGKPHIIAEAHVKKLVNLPDLKTADGPSLLEFARNLTTAERTLVGMGTEYTADLNHMTTLRELVKKLPMFLRAKWTERAGGIIESGHRPSFGDLVKFVQERAKLVDNEFGNDMAKGYTKPRNARDAKARESKQDYEHRTFWTGEHNRQQDLDGGPPTKGRKCAVCLGPHGVWRCDAFKQLDYEGKRKCVREKY